MRIRPKSALDSASAAQSLRLGLRRPTSLYTREARGKGSKSAQNVKILLSLRGAPATWQSVSLCIGAVFMCGVRRMRIATTGVRTGLATAAYLDSLICRLVPLGAMTGGFGRVSRFVMRCRARWFRDGTGAVPYGRVLGTCFLFSPAPVSTLAPLSGSDSRQKFHITAGRRARRA